MHCGVKLYEWGVRSTVDSWHSGQFTLMSEYSLMCLLLLLWLLLTHSPFTRGLSIATLLTPQANHHGQSPIQFWPKCNMTRRCLWLLILGDKSSQSWLSYTLPLSKNTRVHEKLRTAALLPICHPLHPGSTMWRLPLPFNQLSCPLWYHHCHACYPSLMNGQFLLQKQVPSA